MSTVLAPSFQATSPSSDLLPKALRADIRARWKLAANARTVTAAQHAAFTLLMGRSLERAFTPIRHPQKIVSNGNNPSFARDNALAMVERGRVEAFAPWADLLRDVPLSKYGTAYEGSHEILTAASAAVQAFRAALPR